MLNFTEHSTKHSISPSLKNTSILVLLTIVLLFNVTILAFHESFIFTTTLAETNTSLNSEKVQVKWLEVYYPHNRTDTVQIIDPYMNLDSETTDYFDVDVWSDSDQAGIDLTVTETGKSTVFEGTFFYTVPFN